MFQRRIFHWTIVELKAVYRVVQDYGQSNLPTFKCHFHFWPYNPMDLNHSPYGRKNPPLNPCASFAILEWNLHQLLNQFSSLSRIVKITLASYHRTNELFWASYFLYGSFDPYLDKRWTAIPNKGYQVNLALRLKHKFSNFAVLNQNKTIETNRIHVCDMLRRHLL